MTQPKFILIFFAVTILFACEPTVTFDQPQPTDTDNLSKFPRRLQGKFQSMTDNSVLKLNDHTIFRIYDFDLKANVNQIDSNYRLVNDTLINTEDNERTLIKREGDTIIQHIHYIDTLFSISQTNILKKFKGYYFLNFLYDKGNWQVKRLGLHRGQLSISSVSTKEDVDKLKEISESVLDSLPYQFRPTKRQFKKFVKADGFSDTEAFMKIK